MSCPKKQPEEWSKQIAEHFRKLSKSSDPSILLAQMFDGKPGFSAYHHAGGERWTPSRNECVAILRVLFEIPYEELGVMFNMSGANAFKVAARGRKRLLAHINRLPVAPAEIKEEDYEREKNERS